MANVITCAIIDNAQPDVKLLSGKLGNLFKNISIDGVYTNWEDAIEALRNKPFDLLFIEISVPGKNGLNLLKMLPNIDSEVIFVTSQAGYALEAFAFSTSGYLLKPVDDSDLVSAVTKAIERTECKKQARHISSAIVPVNGRIGIPCNNGIDYISIQDILYLESIKRSTKVVTVKAVHLSTLNLSKFQNLVDNYGFFQLNRSFIININHVLRYELTGLVIMADKQEIPLSRSVKTEFLKIFQKGF